MRVDMCRRFCLLLSKFFNIMPTQTHALRMHEEAVVQINRQIPVGPMELKFSRRLSEQEFLAFSAENKHLRIEQDKNGTLLIMPPLDFDGGIREGRAYGYLFAWWLTHQQGVVCSPNAGFKLPDTSTRAADASWISAEKVAELSPDERKKFARIVPDFVIEVRSTSDRLAKLKKKMTDTWIKNGVRLAWLIDPIDQKAYVYRLNGSTETLSGLHHVLNGEEVCPGLEMDLGKICP